MASAEVKSLSGEVNLARGKCRRTGLRQVLPLTLTYRQDVVQNGGTKTQGNSFGDCLGKSLKRLPTQVENRGHCFVLLPVGMICGFPASKGRSKPGNQRYFGFFGKGITGEAETDLSENSEIWLSEKELRKPKLNTAELTTPPYSFQVGLWALGFGLWALGPKSIRQP